ncbi:MAG: DUF4988 domain-containing protein [Lachnospiraceae bacterium]|nr:DUF4988 domain-containing protein [Lachnospiraceae bacterium]
MADSEKMDLILEKLDNIDKKVDNIDKKVDNLDKQVDSLDKRVSSLESGMQEVNRKVTSIELILENEIRTNIQRVAEGHLDLSRNMHEVMKPNNEIEMLAIKVRMLETDMRELKAKIS